MRRLYRLLVRLHPDAFRERFQNEMLWILDNGKEPAASLVFDALIALDFKNVTMDGLVRTLSARMGRPVVNRTQLMGGYDFSLRAAFDAPDLGRAPGIALPPPPPAPGGGPPATPGTASEPAPSIYTAIQGKSLNDVAD